MPPTVATINTTALKAALLKEFTTTGTQDGLPNLYVVQSPAKDEYVVTTSEQLTDAFHGMLQGTQGEYVEQCLSYTCIAAQSFSFIHPHRTFYSFHGPVAAVVFAAQSWLLELDKLPGETREQAQVRMTQLRDIDRYPNIVHHPDSFAAQMVHAVDTHGNRYSGNWNHQHTPHLAVVPANSVNEALDGPIDTAVAALIGILHQHEQTHITMHTKDNDDD